MRRGGGRSRPRPPRARPRPGPARPRAGGADRTPSPGPRPRRTVACGARVGPGQRSGAPRRRRRSEAGGREARAPGGGRRGHRTERARVGSAPRGRVPAESGRSRPWRARAARLRGDRPGRAPGPALGCGSEGTGEASASPAEVRRRPERLEGNLGAEPSRSGGVLPLALRVRSW